MMQRVKHAVATRLQRIGWVYFTNNFYIEDIAGQVAPTPSSRLELVRITADNCARVCDFRTADRGAEYAMKLRKGEVGYFAEAAGGMVGSIWATINRTEAPIVAQGHMRLQPNEALLHDGVTGEKFRGMGVGPFMVASLSVVLMAEYGVKRILADVKVSNRPSLRMLAKIGWQPTEAMLAVSAFGKPIWQMKMRPRRGRASALLEKNVDRGATRCSIRMLRRLTKLAISLAYYSLRQVVRLAAAPLGGLRPAELVVLTYHQLRPHHAKAFERQLGAVCKAGRPAFPDFTPPADATGRFIAVTFDDGFEEAFRVAEPILRQKGICSTWFLTAGYLDQRADWIRNGNGNGGARLVAVGQVKGLDPSLVRIGAHTMTHARLPGLPAEQADRELREPCRQLHEALGVTVDLLSFPYGDYRAPTLSRCRDSGYRYVFGNVPVWSLASQGGFLRGRVSVEPTDWRVELWLKLRGGYNWLALNGFIRHHLAPRTVRGRGRCAAFKQSA